VPYLVSARPSYVSPLLPFERDLIALIGCTEEEYRAFQEEVKSKAGLRPAEYAHIPDIRCEPTLIAGIALAVGVLSTVVSVVLAPKPRELDQQQRQEQRQGSSLELDSATGRTRFNQTSGFGGSAPLTSYNTRVPIPFGRWQVQNVIGGNYLSGGLLVTPSLVWSRMYSYGTHQGFKGLYVVGESGLTPPDVEGIYIGNNALDSVHERQFAVYWSSREGSNRIQGSRDLIAGTRFKRWAGDPGINEEVFTCPTNQGIESKGHSAAYLPSNTYEFGAYAPIMNGTQIRVNWRIIPWTHSDRPALDAARDRGQRERIKIAGRDQSKIEDGMGGVGRGYSCRMGLYRHNSTEYDLPTEVFLTPGDRLTFKISPLNFTDIEDVTLVDMTQRVDAMRAAADDALQIGEMYMIGRALCQVVGRTDKTWVPNDGTFYYDLEVLDLTEGERRIRLAGSRTIETEISSEGNGNEPWAVGPSNFPLLRISIASIRNTRPVESTEFGIRSRVYQQLNGLCNFPTLPTPAELQGYDDSRVQLSNGTQQRYIKRASVFTVLLRKAGPDENGNPYPWVRLDEQFVVVNNTPTDVFNYIRIRRINGPAQMEYRFLPKTGADCVWNSVENVSRWWLLDAGKYEETSAGDFNNIYGTFRVSLKGTEYPFGEFFWRNEEFNTGGNPSVPDRYEDQVSQVDQVEILPTNITTGRHQAYRTAFFGSPALSENRNQTRIQDFNVNANGKVIRLRLTCTSVQVSPGTPNSDPGPFGTYWKWEDYWGISVVSSSQGWALGEQFDHMATPEAGYRMRVSGFQTVFIPGDNRDSERWFETRSQLADVSHYEEVTKSNESSPEHTIVYVNEMTEELPQAPEFTDLTTVGLVLRSSNNFRNINEVSAWIPNGVSTRRFAEGDSTGPSNQFSDLLYFLLTDKKAGLGNVIDPRMIDEAGFRRTALFCKKNNIFFDGVIADEINIRSWMTTTGPLCLSNFVVKNGKFSVEPVLPTDTEGNIITGALQAEAMFSSGNIIEDSFGIESIDRQERMQMRAAMTWRNSSERNRLPVNESFLVKWADENSAQPINEEAFDMSGFCTTKDHAFIAARYVMSVRRRVGHIVRFKTTPDQARIGPGSLIRIATEASPYSVYNNGVVLSDGKVEALTHLDDGTYQVNVYRVGSDLVESASMTIESGIATDPSLFGSLFAVEQLNVESGFYQVEEIGLDEDGMVDIAASHHPINSDGSSVIVADVLDESRFTIVS
jgi:hypothetical protein